MTLLASAALWGSYPATAKLALVDFPPFFLAAVRCTAASCFLLLLARSSSDTICGLGPGAPFPKRTAFKHWPELFEPMGQPAIR